MEFGPVAVGEAEGALLAHSAKVEDGTLKKGRRLTAADLDRLAAAGFTTVTVARLADGDIGEDPAADRIARAADGGGVTFDTPFTGRVNLYAAHSGVLVIDRAAIDAMNRIDPSITIATLPAFAAVSEGRMVATVKIIPYGVPSRLCAEAAAVVSGAIEVRPYRARTVGLVATMLDHLKPATMDKTRRVLEQRLAPSGSSIVGECRIPHTIEAVAGALHELKRQGADFLILFGASAVVDRKDILPRGIEAAGGRVVHFGMPVDPGNLLLLGEFDGVPVIGAPGCARSPKENGFDWVLNRLLADVPVGPGDITGLGVGGLLMEIATRPQPRETIRTARAPAVAALVLAAGRSSRMGGPNKLLAHLDGKPLVRHVVDAAAASKAKSVTVVTGHMADQVGEAAGPRAGRTVYNPDFAEGMASSIRYGLQAIPETSDAVLVLLADMPRIDATMIDQMIDAYDPSANRLIVTATADGRRGNPVLWDRRFFDALKSLSGDVGARHLIADNAGFVATVEIGAAARIDLDTPEALRAAGARLTAGGDEE
ncbi:NTP transferase domain-containing protein [Polymorphum gilvum]|uniref:Molybdenum cofactor cytidylyltransferase / molybdopterin molybdochelatase n=1 Tax=Polymorphum gilvum (strain LMG 25793 / CGMCC 1.9160 / SL003B-26A1) TaxID=991905 RepID=F2IVB1_POLGS|nr:molybdopterin-binding/glycosyltransferase family 2 protein [Polymorphum gilvum]ADZ72629.1 Molybdenum cofactor cytidylyltransferase / molybdopterin molybdochelatase [Polymorphum gilvum SL003B-26A1]